MEALEVSDCGKVTKISESNGTQQEKGEYVGRLVTCNHAEDVELVEELHATEPLVVMDCVGV